MNIVLNIEVLCNNISKPKQYNTSHFRKIDRYNLKHTVKFVYLSHEIMFHMIFNNTKYTFVLLFIKNSIQCNQTNLRQLGIYVHDVYF